MKVRDEYWVAREIHRWRDEVGVKKRCNGEKLQSIFQKIPEVRTRRLAIFAVLASEWLFRVKRPGKSEVESVLGEVERGFRKILPHDLSDLVTEAVAPLIEKQLRKEGRILFPLSPFSKEAPELLYYPLDESGRRRYTPHHRVETRSGPIIWPAPWLAALAADKLVTETGGKGRSVGLDLIKALSDRSTSIDSNQYGKERRRRDGEDLDQYCKRIKDRYAFMLSIAAEPAPEPAADPDANLAGMLKTLGPASFFPLDDALIKKLLISCGSGRPRVKRKALSQPNP